MERSGVEKIMEANGEIGKGAEKNTPRKPGEGEGEASWGRVG